MLSTREKRSLKQKYNQKYYTQLSMDTMRKVFRFFLDHTELSMKEQAMELGISDYTMNKVVTKGLKENWGINRNVEFTINK